MSRIVKTDGTVIYISPSCPSKCGLSSGCPYCKKVIKPDQKFTYYYPNKNREKGFKMSKKEWNNYYKKRRNDNQLT